MQRITTRDGVGVSDDRYGAGPPLVLVHGAFSDHRTNWEGVKPLFEKQFEARPGQAHEGMTTAPEMYAAAVSRFLLA